MGEMISKKADRNTIMDDVKATRTGAAAKAAGPDGAAWAVAEARLGGVVALWDTTRAKAEEARAAYAPLAANLAVANDTSDDLIKAQADLIWNELGRPANDPVFELLFPGGSGFYADANVEEQPNLMLLLAELLESNLSPKLSANVGARVTAIRDAAARLGAAVEAARKPRSTVKLYDRMLTAVARSAHVELARLKRYWKSEGISEADIHTVIPDRPRNYGVPATPVTPSPDGPAPE
jgi:hypothetical protein